jgi:4-hydroxyphenylpyruvate dioxygenase
MVKEFSTANPCGLNGVDFIEYCGPDHSYFETLFKKWGFVETSQLTGKQIKLFQQNDINFILNTEPGTFAEKFGKSHGPAICSTGFRVHDAEQAYQVAISRGAKAFQGAASEKGATPFPAIYGIGDSLIYFIDPKNQKCLYEEIFGLSAQRKAPAGVGFLGVDHFTNNVPVGEMQKWCDFYTKIFNFRETRYFDIKGQKTGLISKVMRSPCNLFAVPINEPSDTKSQIQEYLDEYKGSGIQHLALLTDNIVGTLENLKSSELQFLTPPPETYYKMLRERVPGITEDMNVLRQHAILVDGDQSGYLLQIFSKNIIGPIFYEVIQRKGHSGFGEGNFQALFDAIERDQAERGYL